MGNIFALLTAVLVSMMLVLLLASVASNGSRSMSVDGYVPTESGEVVQCVYDRKTTYIASGKTTTPIFTDYLHCTASQ